MGNSKLVHIFNCVLISIALINLTSCNSCSKTTDKKSLVQHVIDTTNLNASTYKTYLLNPTEDVLIKCDGGTQIYYFANTLVDSDGHFVKDSVSLKVLECYSASDFIKCNVTTQYGDSLLQTGGCINISFERNGKKLKMKNGNIYQVGFQKNGREKRMKLYEGIEDKGKIVWTKELKSESSPSTCYSEDGSPCVLIDTLNYYVFGSNVMNWINCDQLLLKNKENIDFSVDLDTLLSANVNLLFPTIRSASMPILVGNQLKFHQVPTEYNAVLFGYTQINGVYYYCKENIVLKNMNQVIKPKFIKSTKQEIIQLAEEIKWDENS